MTTPPRSNAEIWHFRGTAEDQETCRKIRQAKATDPIHLVFDTEPADDLCSQIQSLVGSTAQLTLTVSFSPVGVRVWDVPCDLSFLRHFPGARRLRLTYACGAKTLEPLAGLKQLEHFEIHQTRSKKLSLKPLAGLKNLQTLHLDHQATDIEVIASLSRLQALHLRSATLPHLSFLENHPSLRRFWLGLGGTLNLKSLQKTSITSLEIWMVNKLSDLTALSGIESLEELKLDQLRSVTALPDFSRLKRLRRIDLERMNGLLDLTPLLTATALQQLTLVEAGKLRPESFRVLTGHPVLKRGRVALGSAAKNKAIAGILPLQSPVSP